MKKEIFKVKLIAVLSSILIVLLVFYLVSNSNKTDEMEIDSVGKFGEYTYRFKGKSKHYSFGNGFVLFKDNYKKTEVSGFKRKQKIKGLTSETIAIYFNDEKVFENENKKSTSISNTTYYEAGEICTDINNCESDYFFDEVTKDNFKESIKVVIKYCTKNKCSDEELKIEYE